MQRASFVSLLVLAVVCLAAAPPCAAQAGSATITGRIVDSTGGVVVGAIVTATNVDTGIDRTTKTTSEGLYRFDSLAPGTYNVAVQAEGFSKSQASSVRLQVGELRDVNFSLSVGAITENVNVTSETPILETSKTQVSTVIDSRQVSTLPTTTSLNGVGGVSNDYAGLATLAPGVKYDLTGNSSDLLAPGATNNRGVLVNIDGGNITDQVVSTRDALGASVDEVREFQVLTNNYNAEYGQAGGVILNVITKSGTNDFHGDGHVYFRGRNLGASPFFYNTSDPPPTRHPPFSKHEGGFTIGGPIVKERAFFFGSYELTHVRQPLQLQPPEGTLNLTQPTDELMWSGRLDFQINDANHIAARYNVQRDTFDNQRVQVPNFAEPESLVAIVNHDNTLNITETAVITPTLINEARFFWHRYLNEIPTKSSDVAAQGPNFYRGAAFCCPQGGLQNRYQYVDSISWQTGAHTVKGGFDISHFPYQSLFQQFHFGEYVGFDAAPNEGLPTQFIVGIGPGFTEAVDNIYGFYVQDSWKIRPNLTLNYGLRYDIEDGAFDGGPNGSDFQANGIIPAKSHDHNNWQPRIGIAWSPHYEHGFLHTLFGDPDKTVIRASFAEITPLDYLNIVLDSLNFDGVNLLTATLTDPAVLAFYPGRPPDEVIQAALPPSSGFGRVRPISPDLRNAENRDVNFTISREFGDNFVLNAGYIGVFGFGLFGERDTNFPAILPDPRHPGFFYFGERPDPRFTAIRTNENSRTSSYHGFTLDVTKRFSHHYQFLASYTLSKQLGSSEDFYGTSEPGDPNNIRAERSLTQNDTRHQGNFGFVYDTEELTDQGVLKWVVNNWTVGVNGQMQSARPYPVSTGEVPYVGTFYPGVGAETQQRPNILPDGTLVATNIASNFGGNLAVSQAGAAVCNCPQTTFLAPAGASQNGAIDSFTGDIVDFQFLNGNLGRNVGLGDPYYRFDVSFVKAFPIRETMSLELKVDVFNIFNHTNFILFNNLDVLDLMPVSADPNCTLCLNAHTGYYIGSNGQPLKLQDLQHGRVSEDLLSPVFNGLGDPLATDIPRQIQLAIKFRF
jgi:hypothetical protein